MIWKYVAAALMFVAPTLHAETIDVSAAISLKESLQKIAAVYHDQTGDEIKLNFGASGQLATQIANGAPVDLFVSAAQEQVNGLIARKAVEEQSQAIVARNALVLIVNPETTTAIASLDDLKQAGVKRIALGEPRTVPAGQYALQALKGAKLDEVLKPKLVQGANVRQVLDYVQRGEVTAGIVYATDARQAGKAVRVACAIDPKLHEPIVYPSVLVTGARHADAARKFQAFLTSPAAQAILADAGFTAPEASSPVAPTSQPVP